MTNLTRLLFGLLISTMVAADDQGEAAPRDRRAQSWWAIQPLVRPRIPSHHSPWVRTPVDAFILAKLQEQALHPAPEADRRTLIRRLTFDLHGLPPTPEEIDAFVTDPEPGAYERLVERLLASPRYGERWARHWLDIVHYGETHGYDKDKRRPNAWPYRDYVIESLNQDKPYARFVAEQLAGDVLYPEDPAATIATGFIAAGPWDFVGHVELREGTVDKEITRSNDRDDMVSTTMATFTSVTAHCARCHDHKFDPISQQDYYRLQAVFAGVDRADRFYDPDPGTWLLRRRLAEEKQVLETAQRELEQTIQATRTPELEEMDAGLAALAQQLEASPAAQAALESPTNGYHSAISSGPDAEKWVQVDLGDSLSIDEIRIVPARPTDFSDTPGFGFPLRFRVELSDELEFHGRRTLLDRTVRDLPNPGDNPFVVTAQQQQRGRFLRITATRLWKRTGDYVLALGELEVYSGGRNVARGAAVSALDSIEAGRWSTRYLVDDCSSRHRLYDRAGNRTAFGQRLDLQAHLARLQQQRAELLEKQLDPRIHATRANLAERLGEIERSTAQLPPQRLVFAAASRFARQGNFAPADAPRPVHLLQRGDVKQPAELMTPGALACLPGLEHHFRLADPNDEGSRRAALAHWITDPQNGLARRSIVNRIWQHHFGRGIVDTPNDFGAMGSLPSHPELLDWLAVELLEHGGSLKPMHRLILNSSAYRQSAHTDSACARIDADNRYLWRMNRSRLDAESIRDTVLYVSGQLDQTMRGPPVDHFFFKDDHSPVYDYAQFDVNTPGSGRRSIYRFIVRSVPDPFMECLDCADPSLLTPRRNTTLTALQALALLNNRLIVRQAEHFAEAVRGASDELSGQIDAACQRAWGRPPLPAEAELLRTYAAEHGLANLCRLLFNSNEFVFVD